MQGLHAVNLGDSGFIVVRDGRTVLKSPSQQHDFNFTYQLESGGGSDLPSSADVSTSWLCSDLPISLNNVCRTLTQHDNLDVFILRRIGCLSL